MCSVEGEHRPRSIRVRIETSSRTSKPPSIREYSRVSRPVGHITLDSTSSFITVNHGQGSILVLRIPPSISRASHILSSLHRPRQATRQICSSEGHRVVADLAYPVSQAKQWKKRPPEFLRALSLVPPRHSVKSELFSSCLGRNLDGTDRGWSRHNLKKTAGFPTRRSGEQEGSAGLLCSVVPHPTSGLVLDAGRW